MSSIARYVVVLVVLLLLVTSCTTSFTPSGWGVPKPEKTNVEPRVGWFNDSNGFVRFEVTKEDGKYFGRYSRNGGYSWHWFPIENGSFYYEWGQWHGTHCPTDAYCISGWFTSPDTAEGFIRYGFNCDSNDEVKQWHATFVP